MAGIAALLLFPVLSKANLDSGPYLLGVTATSVQVVYEGAAPDDPGIVEYGLTPALGMVVEAERRLIYQEMFVAELTCLLPGTVYYYRLIHEGQGTPTGSFVTAVPPGETFSFVVMGDTRSGHLAHGEVVNAVIVNGIPDLVFITGDLVADGEDKDQWQNFFNIEADLLRNSIFGPVYGNHENGEPFVPSKFPMFIPIGDTYFYRYGNAIFIVVNTEMPHGVASSQYNFLKTVLQDAEANPDIDFKFVFFHKPGMTTSDSHSPDFGVLTAFFDLFEQYGVHAVYTGHNHLYEHGVVNGVHHIVSGGGGAGLSDIIDPYSPDGWTIVHRERVYHFLEVIVEADRYTSTAYRTNLSVMDSYTAMKAEAGFPGPTPPDLLSRALGCGCSAVSSTAPSASGPEGILNLFVILLPAITAWCKARRKK